MRYATPDGLVKTNFRAYLAPYHAQIFTAYLPRKYAVAGGLPDRLLEP